jgi:hypothetical protein
MLARMPMTAMTTSNSINVKPGPVCLLTGYTPLDISHFYNCGYRTAVALLLMFVGRLRHATRESQLWDGRIPVARFNNRKWLPSRNITNLY